MSETDDLDAARAELRAAFGPAFEDPLPRMPAPQVMWTSVTYPATAALESPDTGTWDSDGGQP